MIDVAKIRKDFPLLARRINDKPIVYLDTTATSLKPVSVIAAMDQYYTRYCANIYRGIYTISEQATGEYERARAKIAVFINAWDAKEVIFTRNATESINLVAYSWGRTHTGKNDQIVTTVMEHHSNFVPWQQLALENGLELRIWNTDRNGELDINDLDTLITRKTKLFTFTAVSNVLGTINPTSQLVKRVKQINPGCLVLVDAAQAVPHMPVDVRGWGADFVAFSGHKMLGPTGIGVLWGKESLLEAMPPFLFGGEMITEVRPQKTTFKNSPHKFEAGTPDIAGAIGLGAAVDYLTSLGMDNVRSYEEEITDYAMKKLSDIKGLSYVGPKDVSLRCGVIAFTMGGIHPHDIAQILDNDNVCIRAGNHCAMPLHLSLGLGATARASFYLYTTREDVDTFIAGLGKVHKMFAR